MTMKDVEGKGSTKKSIKSSDNISDTICFVVILVTSISIIGLAAHLVNKEGQLKVKVNCAIVSMFVGLYALIIGIIGLVKSYSGAEVNHTVLDVFTEILLVFICIHTGMNIALIGGLYHKVYVALSVLLGCNGICVFYILYKSLTGKS
ncbi:hypothetical protein SNEBB_005757 [Seison nebaliae]|nr:hypothetical protein SNEBB_005757 [Seison nebaliae]